MEESQNNLRIEYVSVNSIRMYENNAKNHPREQIEQIKSSIQDFGMNDPIGIWHGTIVEGHGRFIACKELGFKKIPVIRLDELTDEQRKAYGLIHNKLTMNTDFDFSALEAELEELKDVDMSQYGFDQIEQSDWFSDRKRYDNEGLDEESEEYQEFVEKFEAKRTTDDCYTPDVVYDALADWVSKEYSIDRNRMVRPFYPGGDYQKEKYKNTDVIVDNPPFSILAEIVKFYSDKNILFFLFAPTLTLFSSSSSNNSTALPCGVAIVYENGASVSTSFLTNLEDRNIRVKSCPELYKVLKEANDENLRSMHKELPKYTYPDNIVTSPMVARFSKYGIPFEIKVSESEVIKSIESQKAEGKAIFGGGGLHFKRQNSGRESGGRESGGRESGGRESGGRESGGNKMGTV